MHVNVLHKKIRFVVSRVADLWSNIVRLTHLLFKGEHNIGSFTTDTDKRRSIPFASKNSFGWASSPSELSDGVSSFDFCSLMHKGFTEALHAR